MSQIKLECEDEINEMNASMQNLIEQADWLLSNLEHRTSHSSSSSSMFDDSSSNPSTSRNSMSANYIEPEIEQGMRSFVSEPPDHDVGSDSSGDTIILSNNDEAIAEQPVNSDGTRAAVANSSLAQEVIVIGTPIVTEPRNRQRVRRDAYPQNVDTSVIDLSNYPEFRTPPPTEPIVISSDEENYEPAAPPVTIQQPSVPNNWSSITISSYEVSVETAAPHSISLSVPNRRRIRRRNGRFTYTEDIESVESLVPPVIRSPPPPSQPAGSPKSMNIICPICYETLANQRAISTACGHVFCSNCIKLSLQTAKKCPICNKKITRANQMHPVYFSTG
uniref:RING-type domain-containing protein n=1 Tax=Anopheles funestus TaxID=62324 RepID=A0A182S3K1_ANOFN